MRPISEMTKETTRRTAMKAVLRRKPSPTPASWDTDSRPQSCLDFLQPRGGLLDLDPLHAHSSSSNMGMVPRRSGMATMTRWTFCLWTTSMRCAATDSRVTAPSILPVQLAISTPIQDSGAGPTPRAARARRYRDVNALDKNWQLDQPSETESPSEQGEGEDDQADRGRTAPNR